MGQSASSARVTRNSNGGASRRRRHSQTQEGGDVDAGAERAATIRAQRSRRLSERFALRGRMTRSGSVTSASSSSSSSSSSANGVLRSRVPGLRFRPRTNTRYTTRSQSPETTRGNSRQLSQRWNLTPLNPDTYTPILHTNNSVNSNNSVDSNESVYANSNAEMVDVSPASTITPQTHARQTEEAQAAAGPSRTRTRMNRVRDSISSWSDFIRPTRRSPETRNTTRASSSAPENNAVNDTAADGDSDTTRRPHSPNRHDRPSLFGPGSASSNFLNGIRDNNPSRVRPGEDQAAMLSRLLSVAAAATAASLVGDAEEAISQAQDVGGDNGGDGSFEAFLRALQNGRLETALRNGGNEMGGGAGAPGSERDGENGVLSLNFFRMFRFGSQPANNADGENNENGEEGSGRMVPVIIVGIRSVSPRDSTEEGGNARPTPFFDALANLPVSVPSVQRRPRLGSSGNVTMTHHGHRRATSLGSPSRPSASNASTPPEYVTGINPFATPHHHSSTDTPSGPSPPPTTPSERETIPLFGSPGARRSTLEPAIQDPFTGGEGAPRRDPFRRTTRRLSNPDADSSAERARNLVPNMRSGSSSVSEASGRDFGASNRPLAPTPETRSWIIYVLGGSYPENHPILTTPSLFTDEPTYEDMTLLSSLLGPAKLPVAAREDLESAGGVFIFAEGSAEQYGAGNVERCLICLSDYEEGESCRQLVKCSHIFHRECIDEWLTTGRNSCPLCRGEGVEEKSKAAATSGAGPSSASTAPSTVTDTTETQTDNTATAS
ncbi:hypothetical protein BZA77DRAFT_250922 [Pyronema omphalodes]|nr:hypothetical protein BZA77DRAFT_250922 [Pyronema omphalodes]